MTSARCWDDRTTRAAYDVVASDYARLLPDLSVEAPQDRAVLTTFTKLALEAGRGIVVDVGCGAGRIGAHLVEAGLQVIGVDLSPGMARMSRRDHPHLPVAVAHAAALPVRSGAALAAVVWYSVMHLPAEQLPVVFVELARITRPGSPVVVAFQCGAGERLDRTAAYGHAVTLTSYRHDIDVVTEVMAAAGFVLQARHYREALQGHETTPQAFLLALRR